MEFHVGQAVGVTELFKAVNADGKLRIRPLGEDKIYIPGFVPFQYGKLSEACKPHQKAIARLRDLNLWEEYLETLRYPLQRVKEEEKEEDKKKEAEEEKEGGVGETRAAPTLAESTKRCIQVWLKTLEHFKQPRPLIPGEDLKIGRAIHDRRWGAPSVELALIGARHEPKSEQPGGFDPAKHLSLDRILDPEKFARFVGLGAAEAEKRRAKLGGMRAEVRADAIAAGGVEDEKPLSFAEIQAAIRKIYPAMGAPKSVPKESPAAKEPETAEEIAAAIDASLAGA